MSHPRLTLKRKPRVEPERLEIYVAKMSELNPYTIDADGFCTPKQTHERYERGGPPADVRAGQLWSTTIPQSSEGEAVLFNAQVRALSQQQRREVNVEKLFAFWNNHPRRSIVMDLFKAPPTSQERTTIRRDVSRIRVRSATGDVDNLASRINVCRQLTPAESQRITDALVDLRFAWMNRGTDAGYDDVNWRHACSEVGQILEIAPACGLSSRETEDAILASMYSDAAKLRGNFLIHHIDGAVAAALVLPRHIDTRTFEGRARVVGICQAILEHQVGPPRFMAQMLRRGIESASSHDLDAKAPALERLIAKVSDPLNAAHATMHEDGYGVLVLDADERALLKRVHIDDWYIPHPHTPWFHASTAVIDADSLVNYATPDGVGKIVAITGPGTPFHDATVFDSMFSCGASFVDAVSVMSDVAMHAVRQGITTTRQTIDEVRIQLSAEIDEGWLRFNKATFQTIAAQERIDVEHLEVREVDGELIVDVPWREGGALAYWNVPLNYDTPSTEFEFAKLLRRRVADLLRDP